MTEGSVQGKKWKLSPMSVKLTISGTSPYRALHSVPYHELYVDVSNILSKQLVLGLVRNLKSGFKVVDRT